MPSNTNKNRSSVIELPSARKGYETGNTGPGTTLERASLLRPLRLEHPSDWIAHIPFGHWLGMELSPSCFVELGAHYGHSYFNILQGVRAVRSDIHAFAVDTWSGEEKAGYSGEELFTEVSKCNAQQFGETPTFRSTLLRMSCNEAPELFSDQSIDLLHIVGPRCDDEVAETFRFWRPKLSPSAVAVFHGTEYSREGSSVSKVWQELTHEYPFHIEFSHSGGLGLLSMSNDEATLPLRWLHPKDPRRAFLLHYFQMRSEEVLLRAKVCAAQAHGGFVSANSRVLEQTDAHSSELRTLKANIEAREDYWQRQEARLERKVISLTARIAKLQEEHEVAYQREVQTRESAIVALNRFYLSGWLPLFAYFVRLDRRYPELGRICMAIPKAIQALFGEGLMTMLKHRRDALFIRRTNNFDPNWYLTQSPGLSSNLQNPLSHWLRIGWKQGLGPSPDFQDAENIGAEFAESSCDENPVLQHLRARFAEARAQDEVRAHEDARAHDVVLRETVAAPRLKFKSDKKEQPARTVKEIVCEMFPSERPLLTYPDQNRDPRVTVVTDSVSSNSFFGGVGTAVLFATKLALDKNARLRIVTLNDEAHGENVSRLQKLHGLGWQDNIDFHYADRGHKAIPVSEGECFVSTSWWSTRQLQRTVDPSQITYLLQEDERMFYPFGDARRLCESTLQSEDLRYVVNSRLLFQHLCDTGLSHLAQRGTWFEPAFPGALYYRRQRREGERKRFFFYARPHHPRNLYYLGIEVLEHAVESGLFDPNEWEIIAVGSQLENFRFSRGIGTRVLRDLPWSEYARLIRSVDAGLSLMYTPHPSYPPLDLAACGAVVVTNSFGPKQTLESYSENIICKEPTVASLVEGVEEALQLLSSSSLVEKRYETSKLNRDWHTAFQPVMNWLRE